MFELCYMVVKFMATEHWYMKIQFFLDPEIRTSFFDPGVKTGLSAPHLQGVVMLVS